MGKAVRVNIAPKRFKHSLVHKVEKEDWNEADIIDWIKPTCDGTVWFHAGAFFGKRGSYLHHEITLWFSTKHDAMMFKLEFVI